MSTLLMARTGSGKVTITEAQVIVDAPGGMKSEALARALITRVDAKTTMPSLLGMGGAREITLYSSDGRKVILRVVKPKDAEAILALLR